MSKNVFFIDSRVSDYQALIANLPADSEWFLLDANQLPATNRCRRP